MLAWLSSFNCIRCQHCGRLWGSTQDSVLFFFLKYLLIYLAALGLSCSIQHLWLWHMGPSSLTKD